MQFNCFPDVVICQTVMSPLLPWGLPSNVAVVSGSAELCLEAPHPKLTMHPIPEQLTKLASAFHCLTVEKKLKLSQLMGRWSSTEETSGPSL